MKIENTYIGLIKSDHHMFDDEYVKIHSTVSYGYSSKYFTEDRHGRIEFLSTKEANEYIQNARNNE